MKIIKDLGIEETKSGHRKRFVIAECGCGKNFKVALNAIKTKNTKSCGCGIHRPKPMTSYSQYWVFNDMKRRCYDTKREYFHLYGGRGIKVCEEWLKNPMSFIEWSEENGYKKGLYIDRINPDGNYEPKNCRFVDSRINATNTRLLSFNNKSGYRGVSKHIKRNGDIKWRSRISVNNKLLSLGIYNTRKEAAIAYDTYVISNNLEHPTNILRKTN